MFQYDSCYSIQDTHSIPFFHSSVAIAKATLRYVYAECTASAAWQPNSTNSLLCTNDHIVCGLILCIYLKETAVPVTQSPIVSFCRHYPKCLPTAWYRPYSKRPINVLLLWSPKHLNMTIPMVHVMEHPKNFAKWIPLRKYYSKYWKFIMDTIWLLCKNILFLNYTSNGHPIYSNIFLIQLSFKFCIDWWW